MKFESKYDIADMVEYTVDVGPDMAVHKYGVVLSISFYRENSKPVIVYKIARLNSSDVDSTVVEKEILRNFR